MSVLRRWASPADPVSAYSPELNPVEKLWEIVRDEVANIMHGTIEAMDDAVAKAAKALYDSPEKIMRVVGDGWLRLQANALSKII